MSRCDESEYECFKQENATALSESKVMSHVVPFFSGQGSGIPLASQPVEASPYLMKSLNVDVFLEPRIIWIEHVHPFQI